MVWLLWRGRIVHGTLRPPARPADRCAPRAEWVETTDQEMLSTGLRNSPARPITPGMAESENLQDGAKPGRHARVDRHRIAREAAERAAAEAAAAETAAAAAVPATDAAAPAPDAPPAPAPDAAAPGPDAPAAPAPAAPTAAAPAALAPSPPAARSRRAGRPRLAPPAKDKTRGAVRRPALLSDRCVSCGASTKDVSGMVTELVEVGPIRALRVVACSSCPDRRRLGRTGV
jgi:hypothetical protein